MQAIVGNSDDRQSSVKEWCLFTIGCSFLTGKLHSLTVRRWTDKAVDWCMPLLRAAAAATAAVVSSILPLWQVFIFTDTILICLVPTSLVRLNWYYLSLSSITNPRTLFLVFHNLFSLVFVLLTLSLVMNNVWEYDLTITSVDFYECPSFLFLCLPFAILLHLFCAQSRLPIQIFTT